METTGNNIRYKKSESISTDSIYYKFFDDKGRTSLVRLSDHDASFFREPADFDLPLKADLKQIIMMGESALIGKGIKIPVFIGDEIAGNIIQRVSSGRYGMAVSFKDGSSQQLHSFEDRYGVKIKDRTREEEKRKLKYRSVFNQLEDKGYFIHSGKLDKFTKQNYPVLISDRYYEKNAIPFSESDNLDKYKKYSDERFYTFYISKKEDGKKLPDYSSFYLKTHELIPYLDYLIQNEFLTEPDQSEIIMPKPYIEPKQDKIIRLKGEEKDYINKSINSATNGMIRYFEKDKFNDAFKNAYSSRFDMNKIEKLFKEKEKIDAEYSKLVNQKREKPNEMKFGGITEGIKHSPLGSSKELSISPIIKEHDMIAECGDCGDKFSYQNAKKHILWECPECKSIKRIS